MMPNPGDLERMDLNMLAMYCLRVAESQGSDPWEAGLACRLHRDWVIFIGHTKPPIEGLDTGEKIEAYGQELRQRMLTFLAGRVIPPSLAGEPVAATSGNRRSTAMGRGK